MRYGLIVLWMLFWSVTSAIAQVSVGIGLPGVSIGINLPLYPDLVPVRGYPVYYAPRLNSNYFFYDGMYWVYQGDSWYASSWYNGPWGLVDPEAVPLYVLRIPVRYYRDAPGYFRGWRSDAPPRWGEHWGNQWQQQRSGWDRWNRSSAPAPAPLPVYQRQYSGDRYPGVEQQPALHSQNYRYQPRDAVVRQHYQDHAQVGVGIGLPGVSIGINLPLYPDLVPVPGYPVYYAPGLNSNYFFYDGMYWVYQRDNWYASSWYNGPWGLVGPEVVPLYVLRIPVRYYRDPPVYFRGWQSDAAPRWGEHWGNQWEQQRSGWNRWNRSSAPAAAPLPVYQRQYSGDRYPRVEQQQALRSQNYRYQPRDAVVRQHYREQTVQRAPAPAQQKQQGAQSAREFAPGQVKKQQGAQSAREFAPGQVKKQQGAQSAREFAPGQVKKQQGAQSAREFAPGQQMKEQRTLGTSSKPKDDGKGKGHGKGEERGRGRDK